jgi:hypothetical protein
MPRFIQPALCMLALSGSFFCHHAASGQGLPSARGPRGKTVTNYLFCVAHEPSGQLTALYYSADFVTTGADIRPVQEGFFQFLRQKYSFKGQPPATQQVSCTGVHSVAESQSTERTYIEKDRQDKRYKVIETGWTYGSAATPQPPPAPGPLAAAPHGHTLSPTEEISGVYHGSYQCANPRHETKFNVSLQVKANGDLGGMVTFNSQGRGARSSPSAWLDTPPAMPFSPISRSGKRRPRSDPSLWEQVLIMSIRRSA